MKQIKIKKDAYYDSVFLMLASKAVKAIDGVMEAVASMGTGTNRGLLVDIGFDPAVVHRAGPNDLIIAAEADSEEIIQKAFEAVDDFLSKKNEPAGDEETYLPVSLGNAIRFSGDSNLVLISIPGEYAAREARIALNNGLHVMMFSDHVSIEDEIILKQLAREKGLLMMGPDCGTAIINGVPLCFANAVKKGSIGLVAASGSGLQEVTCCIDKFGAGISQALGTGGRDLKDPRIGGAMMRMGIQALSADDDTAVIVVISKPPAPGVADEIIAELKNSGKPCVVCFLGQAKKNPEGTLVFAHTLEEAAALSVEKAGVPNASFPAAEETDDVLILEEIKKKRPSQKYIRGLFAGGTLADEARVILEDNHLAIHSNIQPDKALKLKNPRKSTEHTLIDLGDDAFTIGRPHPMIDPAIRHEQLEIELADPQVAVILMDFVLGYGAHENPAGLMAEQMEAVQKEGRYDLEAITFIASITGTDDDFQNMAEQKALLEKLNCIVMPSNARASRLAAQIIKRIN